MRRVYALTRDLHLYLGLFLSPFILAFSVSVFYLVHGWAPRPAPGAFDASRTIENVNVSADIAGLQGRARVALIHRRVEEALVPTVTASYRRAAGADFQGRSTGAPDPFPILGASIATGMNCNSGARHVLKAHATVMGATLSAQSTNLSFGLL